MSYTLTKILAERLHYVKRNDIQNARSALI